nr:hypothetical protein [Candidatus Freyarchaeota archaeon]
MEIDEFIESILKTTAKFPWIRRTKVEFTIALAHIRLRLAGSFVDIFYRRKTQNASYSYIDGGERVFGANNMKIGWHIYPFGETEKHLPINHMTFEEFLKVLEKELRRRGKL